MANIKESFNNEPICTAYKITNILFQEPDRMTRHFAKEHPNMAEWLDNGCDSRSLHHAFFELADLFEQVMEQDRAINLAVRLCQSVAEQASYDTEAYQRPLDQSSMRRYFFEKGAQYRLGVKPLYENINRLRERLPFDEEDRFYQKIEYLIRHKIERETRQIMDSSDLCKKKSIQHDTITRQKYSLWKDFEESLKNHAMSFKNGFFCGTIVPGAIWGGISCTASQLWLDVLSAFPAHHNVLGVSGVVASIFVSGNAGFAVLPKAIDFTDVKEYEVKPLTGFVGFASGLAALLALHTYLGSDQPQPVVRNTSSSEYCETSRPVKNLSIVFEKAYDTDLHKFSEAHYTHRVLDETKAYTQEDTFKDFIP